MISSLENRNKASSVYGRELAKVLSTRMPSVSANEQIVPKGFGLDA